MVRRTVTIPDHLDVRVREAAREAESFSAAVSRLLERGLRGKTVPSYVGVASGGPDDSLLADEIVSEALDALYEEELGR